VLLSPGCADPLYRKAIRSSMGGVFKLPYLHADRWPAELDELKSSGDEGAGEAGGRAGYRLLALHLQGSVPHDEAIGAAAGGAAGPARPVAVMVGAEYEGVGEAAAAAADHRVRIPMSDAMEGSLDSLNVNVAAAIVLERVFAANRAT
jgi:tRNA G18 (ribose-2'-O)-methylase SpoU